MCVRAVHVHVRACVRARACARSRVCVPMLRPKPTSMALVGDLLDDFLDCSAGSAGDAPVACEGAPGDGVQAAVLQSRPRKSRRLQLAEARYAKLRRAAAHCSYEQAAAVKNVIAKNPAFRRVRLHLAKAKHSSGRNGQGMFNLAVRHRRAPSKPGAYGNRLALTWDGMLDISFDATRTANALARIFGVSPRTVRRVTCCVASIALERQLQQLARLREIFAGKAPEWRMSSTMWDETSENLMLNAVRGSAKGQQSSTWEVLVFRQRLCWSWHGRVSQVDLVCPPVPLAIKRTTPPVHPTQKRCQVEFDLHTCPILLGKLVGDGMAQYCSIACAVPKPMCPVPLSFPTGLGKGWVSGERAVSLPRVHARKQLRRGGTQIKQQPVKLKTRWRLRPA